MLCTVALRGLRTVKRLVHPAISLSLIVVLVSLLLPQPASAVTQSAANAVVANNTDAKSTTRANYNGTYYYVKYGDTLSHIAARYGTTVYALMRANGLSHQNHIYTGQKLHIPARGYGSGYNGGHGGHGGGYGGSHTGNNCARTHYVRYGESLTKIAHYYGVNAHYIARANGIYDLNHVYVGQRLCIPHGYKPPPHPKPPPPPVHHYPTPTPVYHHYPPTPTPVHHHYPTPPPVHHYPTPTPVYHHYPPSPPVYPPHPPSTTGHWTGNYYNNPHLTGPPLFMRYDPEISFNWGEGGPGHGLPNDYFSVSWTRAFHFHPGSYRFFATADDGVRVYVDNQLVINGWREQPLSAYQGDAYLGGGYHTVRLEYFENTQHAQIHLNWTKLH